MQMRILAMFLALASPASAERITCVPIMACYGPEGKCDPPEVNNEAGIFDFQDGFVLLSAPGQSGSLSFKILAKANGLESTSFFTSLNARHAMFTLFSNGNLAMFAAVPENDGITASAYFSCEDAPWKTS